VQQAALPPCVPSRIDVRDRAVHDIRPEPSPLRVEVDVAIQLGHALGLHVRE